MYYEWHQPQEALRWYTQALAIQQALGDVRGKATTLSNLGSACYAIGQSAQGVAYLQEALTLRETMGDRRGQRSTLWRLAQIAMDRQEWSEAEALLVRVVALDEALDDPRLTESQARWEQAQAMSRVVGTTADEAAAGDTT